MRLVQIITSGAAMYGAQKILLDLVTRLHEDGDEVLVVVGVPGDLTDRLEAAGIAWTHLPELQRAPSPLTDLRALRKLDRMLREFGPDLVASHSSKAGFLARLVCYWRGIPNVYTAHGWPFEEGVPGPQRWFFRNLEWLVGRFSDSVVTLSPRGRDLALRYGVVPAGRLEMIPTGCPDLGARYVRDPQEVFTISMVAEFRPQKDHPSLIEALGGLRDRTWRLLLLGDGPRLEEMKALAVSAGIADRTEFLGRVQDVGAYLARTDLLVLATWWEGLPVSIMEGLSFGLPVVASDVSGVREQVVDDGNGLVVPPGDVPALREALRLMLDEPARVARYAARARPHYLEHYGMERPYAATRALYEARITAGGPRC